MRLLGGILLLERQKAYWYLTVTVCAWGSLYVVSKVVLAQLPVVTTLFMRYLIAGVALFFVVRKSGFERIERADYKYIFFIGFVGYFLSIAAQLWGIQLANASLAALVNALNPVCILVLALIFLKEKIRTYQLVAVAAAMAGIYIVVGGAAGEGQLAGALASLASVLFWSLMSVLVRKITRKYSPVVVTAYGIWIALACAVPASLYELSQMEVHWDWGLAPALLYLGLICTALPHVLWNQSLSILEAGRCALFYPLQPMTAAVLGWMFLNESLSFSFLLGAVLIVGGVLISVLGERFA